ncbi:LysR family transcriptional regulator [Rhodobacteraceae bacterium NNCM2]|nr:LysR family transcriptional regulator [Coraliihabitans acroporae]
MKPSPYQIAAFTHVARERSFSKAAEALGVTQSSITQHVSKLEKLMGTLLFVRRRDGVELTQSARELFDISDRLRTLEQLVEEKIASYGDLSSGYLTIIANAPRPAMPIIASYLKRYPQIQIEFSLYDWTTAMSKLRNREVDIAVITEPDEFEGAVMHELDRSRYLAFMRSDHELAGMEQLSLSDLVETPVILPQDGSFTQRIVHRKARQNGITLSRLVKTQTFPVMKEAVLHGVGVAMMLENSLYPSQNLKMIPVIEMPERYGHRLVTLKDKGNLRIIQSFIDVARQI